MTYYVVATDRQGSEMRPGGIVLKKHVILCDSLSQAEQISERLRGSRTRRFSGIQLTQNPPVLNPRLYAPEFSEGGQWLRRR